MPTSKSQFKTPGEPKALGHQQWASPSLGLQTKFLIGTSLILLICCLVGALLIYFYERQQLEEQAYAKSELVMSAVEASRNYVKEELRPVMYELLGDEHFVREAMSTSYVGRAVMDRLSPALPDLEYRRTSINARNPVYEANETELAMIEYFRKNPGVTDWQGIVKIDGYPVFSRFKPVVFEQECLRCHGDPAHAPRELVQLYGDKGGFRRSAGELAGIVSVGISVDNALAQVQKKAISGFLAVFATLLFIFASLSILFNRIVVSNLRRLLLSFQEATGHIQPSPARDELGLLGISFNTMLEELNASKERLQQWNLTLEQAIDRIRHELEKTQEQLIYNEKMAALGRMTANITHAIRNPLTAAGGFARRLEKIAQGELECKYAGIILTELSRLEKILKDVLIFSQDKSPLSPNQSLGAVIQSALDRYRLRNEAQKIEAQVSLSTQLPDISMNTSQIDIVLNNLLDNVLDALPQGGRLSISADTVEREGRQWVEMVVADNGPGVPEALMGVLFEPFATGKNLGSGLGLPICKKIIDDHEGEIQVKSAPGQGTSIHLFFPVDKH
jgi:signal transduction histidine kinase